MICAPHRAQSAAASTITAADIRTLRQRYLYRGYLQIACLDLTRANQPALPSTPLQGYAVTGWYITWDPTQTTATRPLALQKDGTWYTYKTADGCKAGWTCVVRHAPVGRGAEGRLRVNWDLIRLRVSLRSLATPRQAKNITEVYGPNGFIRTTYTYTPYGFVLADGDVEQPIQWSSEYHDTETALIYYNYRYYNPTDGRWTRRDPVGERKMDVSLYVYCQNNSIDYMDLLGLLKCCKEINKPGNKSKMGTSTDMILYPSAEEAARAAIRKLNPISISEDYEYGGQICECLDSPDSEVKKYFYTYKKGDRREVNLNTLEITCPLGTQRVANWHTHANGGEEYNSEYFSGADTLLDNIMGLPGYLGTPKGKFRRHNPNGGYEDLEP